MERRGTASVGRRQQAAGAEVGAALQAHAEELAGAWRKLHFHGDAQRADLAPGLLEGVVEPLLVEIGRQLSSADGGESPTAPWTRAAGLLRLSAARGEVALDDEFELLRALAEGFAERLGAGLAIKRRIRNMVEAARLLARAELARVQDPARPPPEVSFGGVIVELYEPRWVH